MKDVYLNGNYQTVLAGSLKDIEGVVRRLDPKAVNVNVKCYHPVDPYDDSETEVICPDCGSCLYEKIMGVNIHTNDPRLLRRIRRSLPKPQ